MEKCCCDIQVVIPIYNAAKTLARCLESILAQTYPCWQAILIDDCSKDESVSIAEVYVKKDPRFLLLKNEKNCGAAATRNRGLKALSAKYVAFLDADDFWEPHTLATLFSLAERHRCDIVQGRYTYHFEGNRTQTPKGAFPKDLLLKNKQFRPVWKRMLTGINMNHVCMKLIKTEVIGDLTFDTSFQTGEDLVFCIHLFNRANTYYFTTVVVYHYDRANATLTGTATSFQKKWQANRRISRLLVKHLKAWHMNRLDFYILARMRTVTITISKIVRTLRERW